MPLASWYSLHFYGPAAGASRINDASSSAGGGLVGYARAGSAITAPASVQAYLIRLRNSPATILASSSVIGGPMRGAARMSIQIDVGARPSAEDNAGELLQQEIDNGISFREAMRLMLAAAAGDIEDAGGTTRRVRAAGGTQERILADVDAVSRDVTLIDVSP